MRVRLGFRCACATALLAARPAQAQADSSAPPTFSPWSVGVRLGTGLNPAPETSSGAFAAVSGGFTGSYYNAVRRCSIQLGAWLEHEQLNPYQTSSTHNALLLLPLMLRTGTTASAVHFVVGGGPAIHLTENALAEPDPARYQYRRTAVFLLTGLEVRLTPPKRLETTLALALRVPFAPTLEQSIYSRRPLSYPGRVSTAWLGATLNVSLHPAARP